MTVNSEARRWALALCVCLPYWLIWLSPALLAPDHLVATGFPQYDQPYYLANGRAVFERGNGFFGPNPFDPDLAAPSIYFHWLTWLFGALTVHARLDPGLVYLVVGLAAGLCFSRLTLELVRRVSSDSPAAPLLYVLAMWGGGIAVLARALQTLVNGEPFPPPNALEPFDGWWFQPWGRNLVYATEAVYHVLVLGVFLAFLGRRWRWLVACVALVAATHPFTAAQVLACVGAWLALNQLAPRVTGVPRLAAGVPAAVGLIGVVFFGYYLLYLPRFPEHARLSSIWALAWQESPLQTLLAYALVFACFACAVARRSVLERPLAVFFGVFAAGSFALSHHHWVAPSHQPLHFTRGYLWLCLLLLALPWLDAVVRRAIERPRLQQALLAVMLLLACLDNAAFVVHEAREWEQRDTSVIDAELRAIYARIEQAGGGGVLLSNDALAGYLAATYTSARPYLGHIYNTPDAGRRAAEIGELFKTGRAGRWFGTIDWLVVRGRFGADRAFEPLFTGARFSLYKRRR